MESVVKNALKIIMSLLIIVGFSSATSLEGAEPENNSVVYPYYKVNEKPIMKKQTRPIYPDFAVKAGIEGQVMIKVTINGKGKVIDAKIIKSVPALDAAALKAVQTWTFQPGKIDGKAVNVNMIIPVQFKL